jgi:predicted hydrocarbon binding protein
MRDAGIGRVLVAALHQGIADELPDRLEFYENWLNSEGLRHGTIGLAPLAAVLSFLRTEGPAYEAVTRRAGQYAGGWTVDEISSMQRRLIAMWPDGLRQSAAMRVARDLVHRVYTGSRATVRVRRGVGNLSIRSSIFCGVRDRSSHPLCYFYAAAVSRLLSGLEIDSATSVTACQAEGHPVCQIEVRMGRALSSSDPDRLAGDGAPVE